MQSNNQWTATKLNTEYGEEKEIEFNETTEWYNQQSIYYHLIQCDYI